MSLLALESVTQRFGGLVAVNDLSFAVEPGSIVAMIGPNGAGKSTAFNLITGIYRPSAGHIVFDGRDITGMSTSSVAALGIARTFQNLALFEGMTVLDNVMVGGHAWTHHGFVSAFLRLPGQRREEGFVERKDGAAEAGRREACGSRRR